MSLMSARTRNRAFKPVVLGLFIGIAALVFCLPKAASANEFDCLVQGDGKILRWNALWQVDNHDNGILYRIVQTSDQRNDKQWAVALELSALSKAYKPVRYLTVSEYNTAREICYRLVESSIHKPKIPKARWRPQKTKNKRKALVLPTGQDDPAPKSRLAKAPPPFIHYQATGWVRSDPPNGKKLTKCRILTKDFSCLPEQKSQFGQELKSIEEQIQSLPEGF